jgi:catechol 2,3-dioxygenase-like lactoylglutathione lyase family enzyme
MSSIALDHVVVFVEDLGQASTDYAALGFHVVPGGVHTGGLTHNALIPFADGTYLELLALTVPWKLTALRVLARGRIDGILTRRSPLLRRTIRRIQAGEGLADFALVCSPLTDVVKTAEQMGGIEGPLPGGRMRPDGQEISWRLLFPRIPTLPFLIEDVTPRRQRVPPAGTHPNGSTGIQVVTIVTGSFDRAIARYQHLLGREPFETAAPIPRTLGVEFRVDAARIRLLAPTGSAHPLRAHLARWGEGLYSVVLQAERAANLDAARAHGALITLAYPKETRIGP